jgi:hypothetical protein
MDCSDYHATVDSIKINYSNAANLSLIISTLLKFYCSWGFACEIIKTTIDAPNFIHNLIRNAFQPSLRELKDLKLAHLKEEVHQLS